jgi:hypothetical protein
MGMIVLLILVCFTYCLIGLGIASYSIKLIYFKEIRFWGFWGYLLFPFQKIAESKNCLCKEMEIFRPSINLDRFFAYTLITLFFWPIRMFFNSILIGIGIICDFLDFFFPQK